MTLVGFGQGAGRDQSRSADLHRGLRRRDRVAARPGRTRRAVAASDAASACWTRRRRIGRRRLGAARAAHRTRRGPRHRGPRAAAHGHAGRNAPGRLSPLVLSDDPDHADATPGQLTIDERRDAARPCARPGTDRPADPGRGGCRARAAARPGRPHAGRADAPTGRDDALGRVRRRRRQRCCSPRRREVAGSLREDRSGRRPAAVAATAARPGRRRRHSSAAPGRLVPVDDHERAAASPRDLP